MGSFDAVLCDLDGVLRLWDRRAMTALDLAHGLAGGTLAEAAFAPDRLLPAITGAQTDEEWRASIAADLAPACGSAEAARELVADWSAVVADVDREVADLLVAARERLPVVLVTNATTRLEADLARLGIADVVDQVVNSSRVGFAKPDPRIYRHAAERAGAQPQRCLFVDDTAENVEAARALGMTGLHYRGAEELRALLAA